MADDYHDVRMCSFEQRIMCNHDLEHPGTLQENLLCEGVGAQNAGLSLLLQKQAGSKTLSPESSQHLSIRGCLGAVKGCGVRNGLF